MKKWEYCEIRFEGSLFGDKSIDFHMVSTQVTRKQINEIVKSAFKIKDYNPNKPFTIELVEKNILEVWGIPLFIINYLGHLGWEAYAHDFKGQDSTTNVYHFKRLIEE